MYPRSAVLLVLLLCVEARAADPLSATLPAESTTAAQRRAAALKLAQEAVKRLEEDKPSAASLQEQLFTEAIDDYQRLVEESGDKLLPLDTAERRHSIQARWLTALDLSRLPAPALRVYRNRVDNQARKWFERGAAERDVALLRRVVDEAFCSSYGDDALDLLGDLAFERGRFDEAERWWRHVARPASDAERRPDSADLEPTFPDPSVDVARVRAKQLLARLFAGAPSERLAAELEAYRRLHPKAEGNLAGRKGLYADTLETMLAKREPGGGQDVSWPTFGGTPSRGRVLPPDARDPNRLLRLLRDGETHRYSLENHARLPKTKPDVPALAGKPLPPQSDGRRLAFHPVISGPWVATADGRSVTAYHAVSGATHTWDLRDGRFRVPQSVLSVLPKQAAQDQRNEPRDLRYTLTIAEGKLYARLGVPGLNPDARPEDSESYLVCLDLPPDREPRWHAQARTAEGDRLTIFEGAPVVADGRVYIAATRFAAGQTITSVRCYSADARDAAPVRWQQDVCAAPELKPGETRYRHHLLTVAGPNVVYCSHNGAIVALDARTGRSVWGVRYPSRGVVLGPNEVTPRDLSPCVYAAGRLYVAPADHDRLMCLDPVSGRTLWERRTEVVHLYGVAQGKLVFATPGGLWAVDAATGAKRWIQPAVGGALQPPPGEGLTSAEEDGLPSFGRGILAGDYVFWPTRRRLWVLSIEDGEQPYDLLPGELEKAPPGNLALGEGVFAVAGTEVLSIFTAPALFKEKRSKAVLELPDSPRALVDLGAARADAGEYTAALREFKMAERLSADVFLFAEEARQRQREVLRERAAELRSDRRWDEADGALVAAAEGVGTAERLERLADRAALWIEAGKPAQAIALWQGLLERDEPAARRTAIDHIDALIRRQGREAYAAVEARATQALSAASRTEDLERIASRFPHSVASASALRELARRYAKVGRGGMASHALRLIARYESPHRPEALAELTRIEEQRRSGRVELLELPLTSGWQVEVSAGERLLDASGGRELILANGERLVCREAKTGATRWTRRLPEVAWAGRHADAVLVGGASGVSSLTSDDGTSLWRLTLLGGPFSSFCSAADRVFFLQGGRRLIAADADTGAVLWQRTAPGWTFDGRFLRLDVVGEHLLVQTSTGLLWVLDPVTGATRHERLTSRDAWPRPPLHLGERCVGLVEDARTVVLFDPAEGREWSRPVSGPSTLATGVPPRLAGTHEFLAVLQTRNHGATLQCFNGRTGTANWVEEVLVGRTTPDDLAADATAVYVVSDGEVSAFAVRDGKPLWQTALAGPGDGWRLLPCRGGLVVYPSELGVFRLTLGWLPGALSLTAPASRRSGSLFVAHILDPENGQLVQRVNLPPSSPKVTVASGLRWRPLLELSRQTAAVKLTPGGLAGSMPGVVFSRASASP